VLLGAYSRRSKAVWNVSRALSMQRFRARPENYSRPGRFR
jgi:hypothetical protein